MVEIETALLAKNDHLAAHNRAWLAERGIVALNLMSSPGSGKTTLLRRTIAELAAARPVAVIEGDQETRIDAERIRSTGAPVVQINTGAGCHLDADMLARGLAALRPARRRRWSSSRTSATWSARRCSTSARPRRSSSSR